MSFSPSDSPSSSAPPTPRKRRWPAIVLAGAVLLLTLSVGLGLWAWSRWKSTPPWWQEQQQRLIVHPPADRQQMAETFEQQMVQALASATSPGQPDHRIIDINLDQLNAWLEVRLPAWLEHQGKHMPPGVAQVMLAVRDHQPVIGMKLEKPEQILSLEMTAALNSQGKASVQLQRVLMGNLPLPRDVLLSRLEGAPSQNGQQSQAAGRIVAILRGQAIDPVFPQPNDSRRQFRVVGLEFDEDTIQIKLRGEERS